MRFLYIAFDNPAVETIISGMHDETLSGLPAFYFPFKMLVERGHVIDILLYTFRHKEVVETSWFHKENLIQVHPKYKGALVSLELPLHLAKATREQLKRRHYDFVYGMSEASHMAVYEAKRMGIPCGIRQFGTQEMANVLEPMESMIGRRIKAFKDYTYITLSLLSKKDFILATNDGSRTDELFRILGLKKKYHFFFWRSGVHIPESIPYVDFASTGNYPQAYNPMALSMIGRIASVKRQDRAVRILGELHKRGFEFHLFFVGEISIQTMLDEAIKVAEEYGVEDYVHFEGGKSQVESWKYARNSLVTLLPSEWNRVNIFYEVMGEGSIVITNNNHSIDEFIEPDINCLVYEEDNFAQAAEQIISLLDDPDRIRSIRNAAYYTAREKFMSLEKRFGMEAQLVEDVARRNNISQYPEVL